MRRIAGPTDVATDLFGPGNHGVRAPALVPYAATIATDDLLNDIQEEIATAVEGFGFTLSNAPRQLMAVLKCAAVETLFLNHEARTAVQLSGPGTFTGRFNSIAVNRAAGITAFMVGVGSGGRIQSATLDGTTWYGLAADGGYTGNFRAVAFDGGVWLTVGESGEVQRSTDGTLWRRVLSAASWGGSAPTFTGIASIGNGQFVACGTQGFLRLCSDNSGISWLDYGVANDYTGDFRAVASIPGVLTVVVGSGGEIQTSTNGQAWTKRTPANGYIGTFTGIAANSAAYGVGDLYAFVAVGTGGEIQASRDGIVWEKRYAGGGDTSAFNAVFARPVSSASEDAGFVAVGANGAIHYSPDGYDWRNLTRSGRFATSLYAGAYYQGAAVFGGDSGALRHALITGAGPTVGSGGGGPGPSPTLESIWRTLSVMAIVNPMDFGAAGNGTTDDTADLVATIDALPAAGGIVFLPAGRSFRKTTVINTDKPHLKIWAPNRQAEIFGDVGANGDDVQAIFSLGTAGFGFFGVKFRSNATTRGGTGDDHMITAGPGTSMFEVVGVEIDGSRAAGIFMLGATDCFVNGNYVHRTQADHIHHTFGTRRSSCWANYINNGSPTLGDDGVACVTYGGEDLTGDLEIWLNVLLGNGWGRGYTVVGGENVNIHQNVGIAAAGAGLLIATEPAFDSEGVRNVTARRNRFTQCGHTVGHPGILISGLHPPAGPIDNVTLADNVSASNVNGNYTAEGSITNLTNSGLSQSAGDLAPLPTLASVAIKDTSILMTRDTSHVAAGSRPGLYRIHVRQNPAGVTFQERFEYVVQGTPANVTNWVNTLTAADVFLSEQRTVGGTAYALLLCKAPVTLGTGVTAVTHAQLRAGDQINANPLNWLWARIDGGSY